MTVGCEPSAVFTVQTFWNYSRSVTRQLRDDRGKIFVAISAGWFLSIGVRMAYPVLLPFLRDDYGLSLTMAGLLLTLLWLAYAVGQMPGGMMGDRFGEGVTMAVSMLIAAAMIALIVGSDSTAALFVGTALFGFAVALFGVVRLTALADVYPEQVGTAHGLLGGVGEIGNTVLPPLVGIIAAATVWQLGFGFLIPLFALVAVALWVFVPTRTSPTTDAAGTLTVENARYVLSELRHPSLVLGTVIMVFGVMIFQVFTGFYPTYLVEEKGLSVTAASGLFALVFALGIVIQPLAGTTYDRIGARRALLVVVGTSAVGFALLPLVDGVLSLAAATVLIAIMAGRGTITLSYMTMALSADVQNTGLGIIRTVFFLLSATGPVIFGAIADRGYFDEVFFLLAGISVLSLVVILRLPTVSRA